MTVSTTVNKVIASGNGVTTVFTFSFPILASADLVVIYTDATGVETTLSSSQYTATGIGATSTGGTVTYPTSGSPIATGTTLTIMRVMTLSQGTSITSQANFDASVVEGGLDDEMLIIQQLNEAINRCLMGPPGEGALGDLPSAVARAGQALLFDSSGNPVAGSGATAPVSTAMLPVLAASTLALARQALGSDPANINPIVNPDCNVTQLGTSSATVTDNAYANDGLRILSEASGDVSWVQNSDTLGSTLFNDDKLTIVSNNKKFGMFRPIEQKDILWLANAGTSLIFAFIAAIDSSLKVRAAILGWTGTADAITGDPISAWGADGTNPTLAAGWVYVNTPVAISVTGGPVQYSVVGSVASTVNNLAVMVWNDSKTTTVGHTLRVGNWDLRQGSTVLPFQPINFQANLARCQRYAPVFSAAGGAGGLSMPAFGDTTTVAQCNLALPVTMRIVPTGVTVSNATNFVLRRQGTTTVALTSLVYVSADLNRVILQAGVASGLTAGEGCVARSNNVNCQIEVTGARL